MTPFPPEQIAVVQQANLAILFESADRACAGFGKLVALNLRVMRSALMDTQANTQKALAVKSPQDLLVLQASRLQQLGEQALSYRRHLYDIGSAAQAEFAKIAEPQCQAHNRTLQGLADNLANSAPAGSEGAVSALTSVITATNCVQACTRLRNKR